MRYLLRSVLAFSALGLSIAAHADTFGGSVGFTDSSSNNNSYQFTGSFQHPTFNFTGGVGTTYVDQLTVTSSNANCTGRNNPCDAAGDNISVAVTFTSPNAASADFGGTGSETLQFFGIFYDQSTINWSSNSQTVTFADGSSVLVSLPDFSFNGGVFDSYSGSENLTIKVLSPAVAATPEPSSLVLLGTGLLGMGATIRRKMGV